jgi:hypothetical protein
VQTWGGVTVFLATDETDGTFCCAPVGYNITSKKCVQATLGSYEPFLLGFGNIIFNRTSGSIAPNITTTGTNSIITTTGTNSIITIISVPQDNATKIAIGAGVGVPLVIALIIVSVMLRQQVALRKGLERKVRQIASIPNQTLYPVKSELDSGPTTQVRPIDEAGGLSAYELHGSNREQC